MKRCPKCGFETADSEMNFCPHCSNNNGNGKVELDMIHSSKASGNRTSKNTSNAITGVSEIEQMKIVGGAPNIQAEIGSKIIDGDGNVVGRDIIDQRKFIDQRSFYQKELSEAERLRQNSSQYYNACVELIKDGFIDDDAKRQLNALRHTLGLHKDIAEYIQKEVIEESAVKSTTMSCAVIDFITHVKGYIECNNKDQIQASFVQLEAYHKKIDNGHLDCLYFQLKAILYPSYYLKDYSAGTKSYWEAFWSYVALARMDNEEAVQSLANLVRWDNYFPYQNQSILQTIGLLMQDKVQEAREAYKSIITGYSSDLEPVCDAIRELLDQDWDLVTDVSPQTKFYVESLFRRAYDQIKDQAGKRKAAEIAAIHQQELEAQAIQDKKGNFILQYEAKKGSIRDALILSGATQTQYEEWKRYDANFRLSLENVDKCLAQEKIDAERRIEELKEAFLVHYESDNGSISAAMAHSGIEQSQFDEWKGTDSRFRTRLNDIDARLAKEREEEERRVKVQKERFISTYKTYNCDMQKTCSEVGLSPTIISNWRKSDAAFDNSLNCMERDRRKSIIFKKVIPCIVIAILLAVIYVVGRPLVIRRIEQNTSKREAQAIEKTRQKEIQEGYIILLNDYSLALSQVDRDSMTIDSFNDSLLRIEQILSEIKRIEVSNPTIVESQHSTLLGKALSLCEELHSYFRGKATSAMSTDELEVWIKKNEIVDSVEQRLNLANNSL